MRSTAVGEVALWIVLGLLFGAALWLLSDPEE
jgi:hypothetical protein